MPDLNKILVPIDFSPGARDALEQAYALARAFDAKVVAMHVWMLPPHLDLLELQATSRWSANEVENATQEHLGKKMDGFLAEVAAPEGVEVESWIKQGDPATEIVASAADYDLVVMSTHGRKGVARAVMGSVATKVVRACPVPVWSARMDRAQLAQEKEEAARDRGEEENVVYALFDSSQQLYDAYREVLAAGVRMDDVSLIMTEQAYDEAVGVAERTHAKDGAEAGTLLGGAFGGVLGLLAVLGSSLVVSVPLLVLGPALAFAAAGGIAGGLIGWGVPSDKAQHIQAAIHDGKPLLAVHVDDHKMQEMVEKIMGDNGGDTVEDSH